MLNGITLKDAVTSTADAEARSYIFAPDGVIVPSGMHLNDTTSADYFDRVQMTVKNRPSVLNAKTGLLSKEKRSVSISKPYVALNQATPGGVTFTTIRFEVESHPEAGTHRDQLIGLLQHFLASVDAQEFITRGALL